MKWKNYGLWVSLVSILYMVFKDLGLQIDLTTWETYVTAIFGILATMGIISNPDKGKGFFDKIPDTPVEAVGQIVEQLQSQQPTSQQGMPQQNQSNEHPSSFNTQQYQGYPQQPQEYNQNTSQGNHTQTNQVQHGYYGYSDQTVQDYSTQSPPQDYVTHTTDNIGTQAHEVQPTQVPSEVDDYPNQQSHPMHESQSPNKSIERSSIHGMPVPPNEHM